MTDQNQETKKVRTFGLTNWALANKSTVLLLLGLIALFSTVAYRTMLLELFPEISFPTIFVNTIYPGNPPADIENLITRPLEKELQTVNGVKEVRSISTQDNSIVFVEFLTTVDLNQALQDVKDAVDKAKSELPEDLDQDPYVTDLDFNEFPILTVNLSGDFSINELKRYADHLEDEFELIPEVSKVEVKGYNEREIQIQADPQKMAALGVSFDDIETAVANENLTISGGELKIAGTSTPVRTLGEFVRPAQMLDLIVKREKGRVVYMRDVAAVEDGFEDPLTFARLDFEPVVSLQVVKKSGQNLINATDKVMETVALAQKEGVLPENLKISYTNDSSEHVRSMLSNLENSIIMGIIFVVGVLYFFLGLRNGLFVGASIPLSMAISFIVLQAMGATVNMMVLFGLVLALGMLVDNAIVVVENIQRYMDQGVPLARAAREATGEVAIPIIASTATTLAAFFPLVFWTGIMGEFMKYLPITLIVVLTSSLFAALVLIPVLVWALSREGGKEHAPGKRRSLLVGAVLGGLGLLLVVAGMRGAGTLLLVSAALVVLHALVLYRSSLIFQQRWLTVLEEFYDRSIRWSLRGSNPRKVVLLAVLLFILSLAFFGVRSPRVSLLPINEPRMINVFAELEEGTDIEATNTFMKGLEKEMADILKPDQSIVKSILTTVGKGVVGENETPVGNTPNKGMITVNFVDYEDRQGVETSRILRGISDRLVGHYPGVTVTVEKDKMGPLTGKAVNLEIVGRDIQPLLALVGRIQAAIDAARIPGIEALQADMDLNSPELMVHLDREAVRRYGMSTGQVAMALRTSLFGKDLGDYKEGEDEYPIMLRLAPEYRHNIASLLNQRISFRDQNSGKLMQIPLASVVTLEPRTTFAEVRRKDMDRVVTLYSNVVEGYNAASINADLKKLMARFPMPPGYTYRFTGEQEEQEETAAFLGRAMMIALALIMLILVTQFNSLVKPGLIMISVLFSTIGVFLGLATFRMDFIILMTGIGLISLAGVVVNNAIVLIDFIDYLKLRRKVELGVDPDADLPLDEIRRCIILAGKTRLRPVLLTAITTILGLFPMAVGMNIDFRSLFADWNPHLWFGGDNAIFWGPMSWTVIFGLAFATLMTLIMVPATYMMANKAKLWLKGLRKQS